MTDEPTDREVYAAIDAGEIDGRDYLTDPASTQTLWDESDVERGTAAIKGQHPGSSVHPLYHPDIAQVVLAAVAPSIAARALRQAADQAASEDRKEIDWWLQDRAAELERPTRPEGG